MEQIPAPTTLIGLTIELFLVVSISIAVSLGIRYSLGKVLKSRRNLPWIKAAAGTFRSPLQWLIWVVSTLIVLETVADFFTLPIPEEWFDVARSLVIVGGLSWTVLRGAQSVATYLSNLPNATKSDKALVYALSRLFTLAVAAIASVTVLGTLGIDVSAILAVGGLGAFAMSWAAKDIVANFFGGLMIYLKRPFSVDDWINSPNKNFEGTVEEIGWYMTRIRTLERRPMYVPNSTITDAIIENPGRMYHRRIKVTVGLRYEDIKRVEPIVLAIREMLENHSAIDQTQMRLAHFMEFNAYSLDIYVQCYCKSTQTTQFRPVQQDILLQIAKIVEEQGAEFAFPTQTLHMATEQA